MGAISVFQQRGLLPDKRVCGNGNDMNRIL